MTAIKIRERVGGAVADAAERARRLFDELAAGSRGAGGVGVTRDPYGSGEQFAHDLVARHAEELGLRVERDHACNTYMTWPGRNPDAPALFMGSHLDSVAAGGNYDGAAGVVAGLVVIDALKRANLRPECDIVVMGVRAEESAWFQVSYIGSRAALGALPSGALEAKRVDTGRTLTEHIRAAGGDPEALRRGEASLSPARVGAFIELHIEQAPSLAEDGRAIAIGTGIPGNFRYPQATIHGEYAHVGLPRRFRHDAALAGADFAVEMDRTWAQWEAAGRQMAFTIGEFHTNPAQHALTKVPGEFSFSLDVRAYRAEDLAELSERVAGLVAHIEKSRGVRFDLGPRPSAVPAQADARLMAGFESSMKALGIPLAWLPSPASHDSAAFFAAGIPFGMIFVRNPNGSHHAEEAMDLADFMLGAGVIADWLARELCG